MIRVRSDYKFMKQKKIWCLGLIAVMSFPVISSHSQPLPAEPVAQPAVSTDAGTTPVNLSPAAAEVVRLSGSGVSEDVVAAYIQGSQSSFNLSADDILYLKDVGLSSPVVTAMLTHDTALRNQ